MIATAHPLRLFVYGTLKRGQVNHARFCANATDIVPAFVWGRLYALDLGFPALEVPPESILAQGIDDPLTDAATQAGWPEVSFDQPPGNWDLVEGELMTFTNPGRDLPPIDRLEGSGRRGSACIIGCCCHRVAAGSCFPHGPTTAQGWSARASAASVGLTGDLSVQCAASLPDCLTATPPFQVPSGSLGGLLALCWGGRQPG